MLELKTYIEENVSLSAEELETALFETILVREEQPLFLDRHLRRLSTGLSFMKMDDLPEAGGVWKAIGQCLSLTGTINGAVKLVAAGNILHVLPRTAAPVPDAIAIAISKTVVRKRNSSLARIKTVQRSWSEALRREAAEASVFDCVALNETGSLTEGGRTNLFLIQNDRIFTPPLNDSCLPGVTRSIVLETGWIIEQPLKKEDLLHCEAAFLTNVLIGAVPIAEVVGMGKKDPDHPLIRKVQREIAGEIRKNLAASW